MISKITYTSSPANMNGINKEFDLAVARLRTGAGRTFPVCIGYNEVAGKEYMEDRNPSDTRELLAGFGMTSLDQLDHVLDMAVQAQRRWEGLAGRERARIIRAAAECISSHRTELAATITLEAGKTRIESLAEMEEAADMLRYYASQVEENNGYIRPLLKLSPYEDSQSVLRPYGVFAVIAPFNFPVALAAGMSAGALLGGNAVILKPSRETPWSGRILYEAFRDGGVPEGVFQLIQGLGKEIGDALARDPRVDGLVFTGGKEVGIPFLQRFSLPFPKPCILEMGGKNAAIICPSADLEKAVEGCVRSAFGFSGQKCAALSRVYVHRSVREEFLERLVARTAGLRVGSAVDEDVFIGPVINHRAVIRHQEALAEARHDGSVLYYDNGLRANGNLMHGHFVSPLIVQIDHHHRLMKDELFLPFLCLDSYDSFAEAIRKANDSEYGLTAGLFSQDDAEVEEFFERIEAGVCYSNRAASATTGAWPGAQSFCGWKGSGSSGKGALGPYYVAQFMREQSQTRVG
jgi:1-pyrroline-5-carboxylate dehydrogenase